MTATRPVAGARPRWREALAAGIPLLAALVTYRNAPGTWFAQDDVTFLSRAAGFLPPVWQFRPLSETLAFRAEYAWFGLAPLGYHGVNLGLHLIAVALLYAIARRLNGDRAAAGAAALVFGVSSIAFTPLHWATGIVELLSASLVLAATLLHIEARRRGRTAGLWGAAALALAAAFAKETAAGWVALAAILEWRSRIWKPSARALVPAIAGAGLFVLWFFGAGAAHRFAGSEAYARSLAPEFLLLNLSTYLRWCVDLRDPVRDALAAMNPHAWRVGLPVALAAGIALWRGRRASRCGGEIGAFWLLVFLAPVLPLAHHTYLYYLYLPWAGGALALAMAGRTLIERLPRRLAAVIALAALAGVTRIEAGNVTARERLTRDGLPVDRTVREAMLLRNAIADLRAAALPAGAGVLFVNPFPGRRFDLTTGAATRPEDLESRASYLPLEGAMRGGETLRLFVPGVVYRGFATAIPADAGDAECFLFEQRGRLRRWGRGQRALMAQAEAQLASGRWAEAESTFRRARALADTLAEAVYGTMVSLSERGQFEAADALADSFVRRWPRDPLAPEIRAVRATREPVVRPKR